MSKPGFCKPDGKQEAQTSTHIATSRIADQIAEETAKRDKSANDDHTDDPVGSALIGSVHFTLLVGVAKMQNELEYLPVYI